MSLRNLFSSPVWKPEELGHSIPDSLHAVSMALPRWSDVVGYEEKNPDVMRHLENGYPRFVIHTMVQELAQRVGHDNPCLPFPSLKVAESCVEFIHKNTGEKASILTHEECHVVVTTGAGQGALKAFWQHTGLIVSSRQAEAFLNGRYNQSYADSIRESLQKQLAEFYECAPDDIFLTPTGMAAQYAALKAVMGRSPGQKTAQLGFPYVDTFKLQQKFGVGGILLHKLDAIAADLVKLLEKESLAACFCEIPGNPLLGSADISAIKPALRKKRVPLVVDDVVATPFNVDLSNHADLIVTSLTKYIAGTGDVMGGAVICNPKSPYYNELKAILQAQHEDLLWAEDAAVLLDQARGFPERMKRHNENGLFIAERLREHPAVERVWYPKWEFSSIYESVRRPEGGWGSLLTFLPKNAEKTAPGIYDRLPLCKGPSLGTVFTLACPFTLLAHYSELEWAEACGVPRNLIRLSVGLEDPEELWTRIKSALTAD